MFLCLIQRVGVPCCCSSNDLPSPSPVVCLLTESPAILKLEEGSRDGRLTQFYLPLREKEDKFLVVFAFLKLGLLEVSPLVGTV